MGRDGLRCSGGPPPGGPDGGIPFGPLDGARCNGGLLPGGGGPPIPIPGRGGNPPSPPGPGRCGSPVLVLLGGGTTWPGWNPPEGMT